MSEQLLAADKSHFHFYCDLADQSLFFSLELMFGELDNIIIISNSCFVL